MSVKYITTYIAAGYTVGSGVTELIITPTGGVGGGEILASFFLDLFNEGVVNDHVVGGAGIELQGGGEIFNGSATYTDATIRGTIGIRVSAATGYVTNHGTIEGGSSLYGARGEGVALDHGGTITNGASNSRNALIEGGSAGVLISGGVASVANFGTIESIYRQGVYLFGGGVVTNGSQSDVTALIEGPLGGVTFRSGVGVVDNYGTIESQSDGVALYGGGSVTNGANTSPSAMITSNYGVLIAGGVGTVANFGTIRGLGPAADAVTLAAGGLVANGSSGDAAALISGR